MVGNFGFDRRLSDSFAISRVGRGLDEVALTFRIFSCLFPYTCDPINAIENAKASPLASCPCSLCLFRSVLLHIEKGFVFPVVWEIGANGNMTRILRVEKGKPSFHEGFLVALNLVSGE